ncbi:hypothetical protein [Pseudomonas donghuensis]|uniref:hypothetical protein n=1 Tax=Pseudomonas donghuensis TaxID=1163398 RepID=UPI0021610741|nr:hypothetical protein [Pseudomonas donghuensis]UVL29183.1 hypothetical protein LOY32_24000 [Pseudomonas donghuensis]
MKSIAVIVAMLLSLTGCVGATVVLPHKDTYPTAAHRILRLKNITPVISTTQKSTEPHQWCGVTLWAVILPIPLQLPVCDVYSEEGYGADVNGQQVLLQRTEQNISSPMYACGPFMFMGNVLHYYEGNAICGILR